MKTLVRGTLVLAIVFAACGTEAEVDLEADADLPGPGTVSVSAVDYAYEDVPASISAGSKIALKNNSDKEVHEIVVQKIAEGEERSIDVLASLPEEEAGKVATFVGVVVAFPGAEGVYPEGEFTLDEPGRYGFFCFIKTGADPAAYQKAAEDAAAGIEFDPNKIEGGAPHVTQGMYAEVTVK